MLHREIGEVPQHLWKEDQEIVLKQTSSLQQLVQFLIAYEVWEETMKALYAPQFDAITKDFATRMTAIEDKTDLNEQEKKTQDGGPSKEQKTDSKRPLSKTYCRVGTKPSQGPNRRKLNCLRLNPYGNRPSRAKQLAFVATTVTSVAGLGFYIWQRSK